MTAGSIYAGAQITADDIQGVAPLAAVKSSDQSSPANSVTTVTDSALALPLAASSVYRILFTPVYTAVLGADARILFALPSGATINFTALYNFSGALRLDARNNSSLTARYDGAGTAAASAIIIGTVTTSGAGTLGVQFGQWTANATPVVMKAGSELDAWKIG